MMVVPAARIGPDGRPTFSLAILSEVAAAEAERIDAAQAALVAAGDRQVADPDQANKAEAFRAISRILGRVRADPDMVAMLKKPVAVVPAASLAGERGYGFIDIPRAAP